MSEIGKIIDNKYQLTEYINRGGMSVVYLAKNIRLGNCWAVKEILKTGDVYNQLYIDGLIREANMMKNFDYPAFPRIVDIIEDDRALYLVMDYIEGKNLEQVLAEDGPQSEETVIRWGIELCDALAYLHAQNPPIIYRDMKPSNVIRKPNGSLRIIDFGVARVFNPEKGNDTEALGTKGYAPPEQYVGQTDARSDIYALGVTLRYLLTGINPRSNELVHYPALFEELQISQKMIDVINKCTALHAEDRFQSCAELRAALLGDTPAAPAEKKKLSKLQLFVIGVLALAFVTGVSVTTYSLVRIHQQDVAEAEENTFAELAVVPNVIGKSFEEAKVILEKAGLKYEYVESYNPNVEKGVVISQDTRPNEVLEKNSIITLTVSLGEKETEAPPETKPKATDAPTEAAASSKASSSSNEASSNSSKSSSSSSKKSSYYDDETTGGEDEGGGEGDWGIEPEPDELPFIGDSGGGEE